MGSVDGDAEGSSEAPPGTGVEGVAVAGEAAVGVAGGASVGVVIVAGIVGVGTAGVEPLLG